MERLIIGAGGGGLIYGETYNHMHFLFTGRLFYKWHGGGGIHKWRVGEGGLIIGCLGYVSC